MSDPHKIALLGFSPFEKATFESFFKLAGRRAPGYLLVAEATSASLAVVNSDDSALMQSILRKKPCERVMLVGASDSGTGWPVQHRPLNLMKMLGTVERLLGAQSVRTVPAATPAAVPAPVPAVVASAKPSVQPSAAQSAMASSLPAPNAAVGARMAALAAPAFSNTQVFARAADPASRPAALATSAPVPAPAAFAAPVVAAAQGVARSLAAAFQRPAAPPVANLPSPSSPAALAPAEPAPQPAKPEALVRPLASPEQLRRVRTGTADFANSRADGPVLGASTRPMPSGLEHDDNLDHILVVDDSDIALKFMRNRLTRFGFRTDLVSSGEEALGRLNIKPYKFIFLDVMMEGLDGYQTCRAIKQRKYAEGKPPVVVMLTSRGGTIDKIRGTLAGCDAYLTKPLNERDLIAVLAKHDRSVARGFQETNFGASAKSGYSTL